MKTERNGNGARPKLTLDRIAQALDAAARDAVDVHRKAGLPLVVWKKGRTELIAPDFFSNLDGKEDGPVP